VPHTRVLDTGAAMRKSPIIGLILLLTGLGTHAGAAELTLAPNAPDRYIVVPGDTLWGISGRFLNQPWYWPQLFELNRDQIRNPHLIYPGDVIVLDRAAGRARLISSQTVDLKPRIRIEASTASEIPSIPPAVIEPFLSQPLVMDQATIDRAPRIVATEENRVVVGTGNKAYARGISGAAGTFWQVFRPGGALIDPDSKESLGFEAIYLGEARVVRAGEVSTLEIVRSNQEMYIGDRMFSAPKPTFTSYVPRAPEKAIKGRVIAAYGGLAEVGASAIVTLNKGTRDGVEVGHVLAVLRSPESGTSRARYTDDPMTGVRNTMIWGRQGPTGAQDPVTAPSQESNLPTERHALVFVFRAFDKVSYALVMQASAPVSVLDRIQNP
jgi:hypothetical protein